MAGVGSENRAWCQGVKQGSGLTGLKVQRVQGAGLRGHGVGANGQHSRLRFMVLIRLGFRIQATQIRGFTECSEVQQTGLRVEVSGLRTQGLERKQSYG